MRTTSPPTTRTLAACPCEVAAPFGLIRSRGVTTVDRGVQVALSVSLLRRGGGWTPGVPDPQHAAFATDDADGVFVHLSTEVLGGRVFFEVVRRLGGYDGYGAVNTPVRMAAHRRARQDTRAGTPSTRSR